MAADERMAGVMGQFGQPRLEDTYSSATSDLLSRILDVDARASELEKLGLEIIDERSMALGAVFKQLAVTEKDSKSVEHQEEKVRLLEVASHLIEVLGIDDMVAIKGAEKFTEKLDLKKAGEQIRKTRKKMGLNQSQFAEVFGLSRFTINRAEQGKTKSAIEKIMISDAFIANDDTLNKSD